MGYFSQLISQARDPHAGVQLRPLQPFAYATRGERRGVEEITAIPAQSESALRPRRIAAQTEEVYPMPTAGQPQESRVKDAMQATPSMSAVQERLREPPPKDPAPPVIQEASQSPGKDSGNAPAERARQIQPSGEDEKAVRDTPAARTLAETSAGHTRGGISQEREGSGFGEKLQQSGPLDIDAAARLPQQPPQALQPPDMAVSPRQRTAAPAALGSTAVGHKRIEEGHGTILPVPRAAHRTTTEPSGPPTIEIHIGRIDVRAAPQSLPARAPEGVSPALPLDAFLKNGGRA